MSKKINTDEQLIIKKYVEENKTLEEIGNELQLKPCFISNVLKRNNVKTRSRLIDLTDRKIGKWTVIERFYHNKKETKWLCKCECGEKTPVLLASLLRGTSRQCKKCYGLSIRSKIEFREGYFLNIKNLAKKRNLTFDLTREELESLFIEQDRKCKLSGIPITFANTRKKHNKGLTTASLDRIDSSKGYIKGNVQWVHKDINLMKQNFELKYFIYLCNLIGELNVRGAEIPKRNRESKSIKRKSRNQNMSK